MTALMSPGIQRLLRFSDPSSRASLLSKNSVEDDKQAPFQRARGQLFRNIDEEVKEDPCEESFQNPPEYFWGLRQKQIQPSDHLEQICQSDFDPMDGMESTRTFIEQPARLSTLKPDAISF
jgi:hypothetical protein